MHNHEAKSAELHFALLTHMRTSFVNPLPREDMYALSRYLNEAMEKLDAAAELVSLYKLERLPRRAADQLEIISRQAELTVDAMRKLNNLDDLEDYWIEILRLAKRAERTHRVWVADMLNDMKSAQYARNRDVANQLVEVPRTCGGSRPRWAASSSRNPDVTVLFFGLVVVSRRGVCLSQRLPGRLRIGGPGRPDPRPDPHRRSAAGRTVQLHRRRAQRDARPWRSAAPGSPFRTGTTASPSSWPAC